MVEIDDLVIKDLPKAIALWDSIEELHFPAAFDTVKRLTSFLKRNQNLSTLARKDGQIVGALLCGNDGRRGFFYHIGVRPDCREQGIAKQMVDYTMQKLKNEGMDNCFLFTNDFNQGAQAFWAKMGFEFASHVMYHSRLL